MLTVHGFNDRSGVKIRIYAFFIQFIEEEVQGVFKLLYGVPLFLSVS